MMGNDMIYAYGTSGTSTCRPVYIGGSVVCRELTYDALGSTAYLTDGTGAVAQTLNYLPYGEDWVELNTFAPTDSMRLGVYRFNGKEKVYESGFHYYGARYYESEILTGWLSVDPLADKYPDISP